MFSNFALSFQGPWPGSTDFDGKVDAEELITLVYKTSLGMTRLLSTQHHSLGPGVWMNRKPGNVATFRDMTGDDD